VSEPMAGDAMSGSLDSDDGGGGWFIGPTERQVRRPARPIRVFGTMETPAAPSMRRWWWARSFRLRRCRRHPTNNTGNMSPTGYPAGRCARARRSSPSGGRLEERGVPPSILAGCATRSSSDPKARTGKAWTASGAGRPNPSMRVCPASFSGCEGARRRGRPSPATATFLEKLNGFHFLVFISKHLWLCDPI
jgi:hypothetical protein